MQLNVELLICKAGMLKEYFALEIDELGNLCTLPVVLDQYTPDMDRLPSFVLNLGNNVRTDSSECYEHSISIVIYKDYQPLMLDLFLSP